MKIRATFLTVNLSVAALSIESTAKTMATNSSPNERNEIPEIINHSRRRGLLDVLPPGPGSPSHADGIILRRVTAFDREHNGKDPDIYQNGGEEITEEKDIEPQFKYREPMRYLESIMDNKRVNVRIYKRRSILVTWPVEYCHQTGPSDLLRLSIFRADHKRPSEIYLEKTLLNYYEVECKKNELWVPFYSDLYLHRMLFFCLHRGEDELDVRFQNIAWEIVDLSFP